LSYKLQFLIFAELQRQTKPFKFSNIVYWRASNRSVWLLVAA